LFNKRLHKHLTIAKPTNLDDSRYDFLVLMREALLVTNLTISACSNSDTTVDDSDMGSTGKSSASAPVLEELKLKYDKNGFIVDTKNESTKYALRL